MAVSFYILGKKRKYRKSSKRNPIINPENQRIIPQSSPDKFRPKASLLGTSEPADFILTESAKRSP